VLRRAKLSVAKGLHTLRLPDLPGSAWLDAVRVQTEGAKVIRVELEPVDRERFSIEQVDALLEQLESLRDRLAENYRFSSSLQAELQYRWPRSQCLQIQTSFPQVPQKKRRPSRTMASCRPAVDRTPDPGDNPVIARSPRNPVKGGPDSGPGQYEVGVERVVKGALTAKKISVLGWQGMCSYGITDWTARRQVLFLARPPKGETRWHTVNYGCAVKAFELKGENVLIEDKAAPLGGFLKNLGLR
jgi:hypothetical protein